MICKKCNGRGYKWTNKKKIHICDNCNGRKELDWLEEVFGVEDKIINYSPKVTIKINDISFCVPRSLYSLSIIS
jgi:hypothetical protein